MVGSFDNLMTDHCIVDSRATNHITFKNSWLSNPRSNNMPIQSVHLPNGQGCKVTHIGSYTFFYDHRLNDVLHVPKFYYNVLAASKLMA